VAFLAARKGDSEVWGEIRTGSKISKNGSFELRPVENAAQLAQAAGSCGADGTLWHSKFLAYCAIAQFMMVEKFEKAPASRVELGKPSHQELPFFSPHGFMSRIWDGSRSFLCQGISDGTIRTAPAKPLRRGDEPRGDALGFLQTVQPLEERKERSLEDVLAVLVGDFLLNHDRIHEVRELVDQRGPRLSIAIVGFRDEGTEIPDFAVGHDL
jgi:hypothetical protein